jgi:hypothetical protein
VELTTRVNSGESAIARKKVIVVVRVIGWAFGKPADFGELMKVNALQLFVWKACGRIEKPYATYVKSMVCEYL